MGPLAAAALAVAAGLVLGLPAARAQAADPGLAYYSAGTWSAQPSLGRIHVDLQFVATSNAAQSASRRYYFPGLALTLPSSSTGYVASDAKGNPLAVNTQAVVPSGVAVFVTFNQRLYAGQNTAFNLGFDIKDPGGSTDRDLRIGQDLLSFPVRGFGSPGTPGSSVQVVFPAGYAAQEQFGSLTSATDSTGQTVFSSGQVPDPAALNSWFTATRNVPANYLVSRVAVGPMTFTLRYWADDSGWAEQVSRVLVLGYPIVKAEIGLGDPGVKQLTLQEVTTQGIGGFSGEYDPTTDLVQVSYFADPLVVLHEIAHLWFNYSLASDRWIDEGFASYYAEQAVLQLGMIDRAPTLGPSLMRAGEPLNDWNSSATPGSATTAYLYGASLQVAREIAAEAGIGGLQRVWIQARARTSTYAGGPASFPDLPTGGVADWRSLLDYLEALTARSYTAIWQQWVVSPAEAQEISARAAARSDYAATASQTGDWSMPPDVRQTMSGWEFGTATTLLARARNVLAMERAIEAEAPKLDLTLPSNVREAFEREGTASALDEARFEQEAMTAIAGAMQARAESQGAARVVGLIGANPDSILKDARAAFEEGNMAQAQALAESARSAWVGAAGVGQLRILGSVAGSLGVLLLLSLFIWTRPTRRRGSPIDATLDEPPAQADA
jgi:hypothetical protein